MNTKNTGLTPKIREEKAEENFIYTDEITDCHQVYMIDMPAGNPVNTYVLTRESYNEGLYYFLCLSSKTSNGNTYCQRYKTIKEAVEDVLNLRYKIFIAHELNHKDALQWLIDNGK